MFLAKCHKAMSVFTADVDNRIMRIVQKQAQLRRVKAVDLSPVLGTSTDTFHLRDEDSALLSELEVKCPVLSEKDGPAASQLTAKDAIHVRVAFIQQLNALYGKCLRLVATGTGGHPTSLSNLMGYSSYLFYTDVKTQLVDNVLKRTQEPPREDTIVLDRKCAATTALFPLLRCLLFTCCALSIVHCSAAESSVAAGLTDPSTSRCLFAQLFSALRTLPEALYRCRLHEARGNLFAVKFHDEEGLDFGGLYRCVLAPNAARMQPCCGLSDVFVVRVCQ